MVKSNSSAASEWLVIVCIVCVMGSMKLYGCMKGARQTSGGSTGRAQVAVWLESQTGMSLGSVKVCLLCPRLSRASNVAGIPVSGGEAARGLELSAPLDCLSRPDVSIFCRYG